MKLFKIILLLSFVSVFSQNKKLDSLNSLLEKNIVRDTIRVNLLNKIAFDNYRNDKKKSLDLVNEALIISDSLAYLQGLARSYYIKSKIYTIKHEYDKADDYIDKAFNIFTKENNQLGIARCISHRGIICYYKSDFDKALEYFYKVIEVNESNNNIIQANAYSNIGLILNNRDKLEEALKYYKLALGIHKENSNYKRVLVALSNIGVIYIKTKKYDEAKKIYEENIIISKKNNDKRMLASSYYYMGTLKVKKNKYIEAHQYYNKAIKLQKEIEDYNGVCISSTAISDLYFKQKKYDLSLKYIKNSEIIANKYSLLNQQQDVNEILSNIYLEKKQYKKSLEHYINYKKLFDSTFNIESLKRIEDLKLKYKFKSEKLKLTEKINIANEKLNKTNRNILLGFIVILLLITLLGIVVYKSRLKRLYIKNQKIILEQKLLHSQMNPHFVFNSLSVLQGIVLQKEFNKAQKYISKFSRLLRIVLEKYRHGTINIKEELAFIENYVLLRNMNNKELQCSYNVTIDDNIDVEKIFIPPMILQPIIENSFEHGFIELNKNYTLSVHFKLINSILTCTIIDNGEGYSQEKINENGKKSVSSEIILERLNLYSLEFNMDVSIKAVDRSEFDKKGVEVTIELPYKISNND